jgi:hypothetical protein
MYTESGAILSFLLLVYAVYSQKSLQLDLPASFSRRTRSSSSLDLSLSSLTKKQFKDLIFQYELQSHVDIILVSARKIDHIEEVNDLLLRMSKSALYHRNTSSTHEDLIYHISVASPNLFNQLSSLESTGKHYSSLDVEKVIAQDFHRRSSLNALYIVYSPIPLAWQDKACSDQVYRGYTSPSNNFAWMYLYASTTSVILPPIADNIVVYPTLPRDKPVDSVTLASVVAKASEYINPYPMPQRTFNVKKAAYTRTITLLKVHICIDELTTGDSALCKMDGAQERIIGPVVIELAPAYASSGVKLIAASKDVGLGDLSDLADVLIVSSVFGDDNTLYMNSSMVGNLLSHSLSWKDIILEHAETSATIDGQPVDILLPVLSITSSKYRIILDRDRGKASSVVDLVELDDPWHITKLSRGTQSVDEIARQIADHLVWPSKLVIAVNNAKSSLIKEFECSKDCSVKLMELEDANLLRQELFANIQLAAWGIMPHYQYFSPLTNRVVKDILWTSSALSEGKTFQSRSYESRVLARQLIVYRINNIQHKLVALVDKIEAIHGVNISMWLRSKVSSTESTPKAAGSAKVPSSFTPLDLFSKFLKAMDEVSNTFTHAEYKSALIHLSNVEVAVGDMERLMTSFIMHRGLKLSAASKITELADDASGATAEVPVHENSNHSNTKKGGSMLGEHLPSIIFIVIAVVLAMSTYIDRKKPRYEI